MKRLISFFVLSALVLSFSSCQKQKTLPKTEMKTEYKDTLSYVDKKHSIYELQEPYYWGGADELLLFTGNTVAELVEFYKDDIFVGKVVAAEKIIPKLPLYYLHNEECKDGIYCEYAFTFDKNYKSYYSLTDEIYIYTVEIETVIRQQLTVQNTTIWVMDGVAMNEKPYEVGQQYIFSAYYSQYGDKTVLRMRDVVKAKVDSDGNIQSMIDNRESKVLNEAGNVKNIISSMSENGLKENFYSIALPLCKDYGYNGAAYVDLDNLSPAAEQIINDIRKALVIENNFRMDLTLQFYDWPKDYAPEQYEKYYPDK